MKITFSTLSTKALGGLAQDTIKASTSGRYTVVANHPLLLEVVRQSADYDKVYSKLTYSGQGKAVEAADVKRDTQYSDLKAYVGGVRRLSKMPHAADAAAIYKLLNDMDKGLTDLSYVEESAQMRSILKALAEPGPLQQLTNLGLISTVKDLQQAQDDFEKLYAQQAEANADLRQLPSASAIRKTLEKALKNYFGLLENMKAVAGWEGLYHEVNEYVKAAR